MSTKYDGHHHPSNGRAHSAIFINFRPPSVYFCPTPCGMMAGMWLATKHGFYSIVQKGEDEFHVRGRVRRDLENLLELVQADLTILEWPGADYRFRIIAGRSTFIKIMAALALDLDYPNFKAEIAASPDQHDKLEAFHQVWCILAQLQPKDPEP